MWISCVPVASLSGLTDSWLMGARCSCDPCEEELGPLDLLAPRRGAHPSAGMDRVDGTQLDVSESEPERTWVNDPSILENDPRILENDPLCFKGHGDFRYEA